MGWFDEFLSERRSGKKMDVSDVRHIMEAPSLTSAVKAFRDCESCGTTCQLSIACRPLHLGSTESSPA